MSLTPAEKATDPAQPFRLDARLEADSAFVCDLALCQVRMMNNRLFRWLLLVPQVGGASEIIDLSAPQRQRLMEEIAQVSEAMQKIYQPAKLNVAALGNQVSQLHVHVIARMVDDAAWPNPVWGQASEPFAPEAMEAEMGAWRAVLGRPAAGMA